MPEALSPEVAAEMRKSAQAIRAKQSAGGNFTRSWALAGKKSIVEPGKNVVVRLLPRWDYAQSMVKQGDKMVPNPQYRGGRIYVGAIEHWWESEGATKREFCPRTLDAEAMCIICTASAALMSGTEDEKKLGKRIAPKNVYIFNAVVGDPRRLGEDKLVDIRIIACSELQFFKISDIMTGGEEGEKFARGNIANPRDGVDLLFKRPMQGGGGERWDVVAAPNATPLYGPAQQAAFKGWVTKLIDLDDMLKREVKDSAGIFKAYYGRDPEPGELGGPVEAEDSAPVEETGDEPLSQMDETSAEPMSPDDEFMPPPASSQPAQKSAPKATASAPKPAVRAPRR